MAVSPKTYQAMFCRPNARFTNVGTSSQMNGPQKTVLWGRAFMYAVAGCAVFVLLKLSLKLLNRYPSLKMTDVENSMLTHQSDANGAVIN